MNKLFRSLVTFSFGFVIGSLALAGSANELGITPNGLLATDTGSALDFSSTPLFTFDLSFNNKIVNQTLGTSPNSLTIDKYGAGFKVHQSRKIEGGVGIGGVWNLASGGLLSTLSTAGVGVVPVGGTMVIADRFAPTQIAAQNLPQIRIPTTASDFAAWANQDAMTFKTSGGVLFTGWIGYAGVGAAPVYVAKGQWTTYIQKVSASTVFVKITKSRLHSLGVVAGSLLTPVSLSRFNNSDQSFSYLFDISNPTGAAAYQDFINGNVAGVQKLAKTEGAPVQLDMTTRTQTVGKMAHFWFGIPMLLDAHFSSGKIYSFQDTLYHLNGSESQINYGIHLAEKSSHLFFREKGKRVNVFYGTAATDLTNEGAAAQIQSGNFIWSYEKEHTSAKDLTKAVAEVIKDTGLRQDLSVSVPQVNGDLGYAMVKLTMTLTQNTTNFLVNMAQFPNVLAALEQSASSLAKNYFASGDVDGICTHAYSESECQDDVEADTVSAARDMTKQITIMKRDSDNRDWKGFVRAYAQFGKAMTKNQFTVQAVLLAVQSQPPQLSYEIEGQRLSIFKREILQPAVSRISAN